MRPFCTHKICLYRKKVVKWRNVQFVKRPPAEYHRLIFIHTDISKNQPSFISLLKLILNHELDPHGTRGDFFVCSRALISGIIFSSPLKKLNSLGAAHKFSSFFFVRYKARTFCWMKKKMGWNDTRFWCWMLFKDFLNWMKTIIKLKNYGAYVSLRDEWKFYLHPLSIMIGFAFDFHSIFLL